MDFLDRLIDYIESNIVLSSSIIIGNLDGESESISIRPTPSNTISEYLDRDRTYEYSFQILYKHPHAIEVEKILYEITDLLDFMTSDDLISESGSFNLINCKPYVYPNYVETTDHNEVIYTAMYVAEIQGGK